MRGHRMFPGPLPAPKAVDPRSGFTIAHSELVKEFRGNLVARRYADRPHPRDLPPPAIRERIALPSPRPEPEPVSIAVPLMWETSGLPILTEDDEPILSEGRIPVL